MAAEPADPRSEAQRTLVAEIDAWAENARAGGEGHTLWVCGEAGAGKSWAVEHARTQGCEVWHTGPAYAADILNNRARKMPIIMVSIGGPTDEFRARVGDTLRVLRLVGGDE